jgi:hypothetical protein
VVRAAFGVRSTGVARLSYNRAAKVDATKIAKRFEETHKVKRRIYFVKRGIEQLAIGN